MKRFKQVEQFRHSEIEHEVLRWWKERQIFPRSIAQRENGPTFSFYEGPPTANGKPGIHHVLARTIKDIFCRYKTMKGFRVERKAGWDTHGLPVEIEVEKELGLEGRAQVEAFGIEKYNAACRRSVLRYKELWDQLTERIGYWVDLEHPYITFENTYIETVWWLIKQIYEKGLLYKGYKIQWYSPGSGTVLSSHEVSLGYKEVDDPSAYVRFPVLGAERTYLLAWTTTPWTLISNVALAVGADIPYVKVRREDPERGTEYLILAQDRLDVLRDESAEVVETFPGRALVGTRYEPLFPYFKDRFREGEAWRVIAADFVSTEEGTGIVHLAPAFGAEDYEAAQKEGLPLINPITPEGTFTDEAPLVAGLWFKDADRVILRDLRQRGLLFRQETYRHNYPHDWRKGTPLMNYPVESWFIRTTAVKDRMIELNKTIHWHPPSIGEGRFGEWLRNNVDWALSRQRYWGTPLPIWQSDRNPDYIEVIGSIEELRQKLGGTFPPEAYNPETGELDLHRPYVDRLTWPAPDGGTMRRVPDLIDVWFDSGAMPFAQWHYPFENQEAFRRTFPADFIAEGVDQTRGWFYTLHAIATMVMDSVAFRHVVVNGLVLDEKGEKMSKSKGNVVDPFDVVERYGADPVRWYMISNAPPWENIRFSERELDATRRRFFNTLENVYAFFATYANVDGFVYPAERMPVGERTELDRWIISRLNSTVAEVEAAYEDYHPTRAARAIERFVDELSNWYIRRSRRRFWSARTGEQENERDKQAAYQTVYECLETTALLMAPIAPFFSEWLYRALQEGSEVKGPESVHLADFPKVDRAAIDPVLEQRMALARTIVSIVLALRNQARINVRQPLPRILVVTGTGVDREVVESVRPLILEEVNVKDIEYVEGTSRVVRRTAKPNYPRLGKRLGKLMKGVAARVAQLTEEEIDRYLREGKLVLEVDGQQVELGPEDLEIKSEGIEGWLVGQEDGVTVALDTNRTEELILEGLAREAINRIQNLRKKAEFEVTDRIVVSYRAEGQLARALERHADWIRNETLAVALQPSEQPTGAHVETFDIDGETFTVGVQRVPVATTTGQRA
ncbi:isoleucine--tRNA ligase [Rhodothermus marinus]|uniref:isoleucine--tRNA ligase n=1 Tax=Rhodothermus marinus TaxID=29549 RepID=UPI0037C86962